MPQAPLLSLSSSLTNAFFSRTNPEGEEEQWSPRALQQQTRVVIWLRKTGACGLMVVATAESLALLILRSASWFLSPITQRPYKFLAKLLQSSEFTIFRNWIAVKQLGHYQQQYTRESSARCGFDYRDSWFAMKDRLGALRGPFSRSWYERRFQRREDFDEITRHPWADGALGARLYNPSRRLAAEIQLWEINSIQEVVHGPGGDNGSGIRTPQKVALSTARNLIGQITDPVELAALVKGRLESPVLRKALWTAVIDNEWCLGGDFVVEADLIANRHNPSPEFLERFISHPQIGGPRGFFCAYVLPEVRASAYVQASLAAFQQRQGAAPVANAAAV